MSFPWLDWQFYAVTAAAMLAAWIVMRQFLPRRGAPGPDCGACAAGAAASVKKPTVEEAEDPPVVLGRSRQETG